MEDAWKLNRISINYHNQRAQLPDIKLIRPELDSIYSQILQDVLRRVSKTFDAYFRRISRGEKADYPRFKGENRFDSFSYVQSGFKIVGDKLHLSKIGSTRIRLSREIVGNIKTCTIKREVSGWFVIFAVEDEPVRLPHSDKAIGIDVGLENFATYTTGEPTPNPRFFETLQSKLRVAQRKVARRKKGSHRRRKAVLALRKIHQKIKECRNDFHHKLSRKIVNEYGTIAVEDLNIKGMSRGILSKQILDAGWASFLNKIEYKAESAGRDFWKVDARGTSQTCTCGATVKKDLSVRLHHCLSCGLSAHRDFVSAQIILNRAGLNPSGANVNRSDYAFPENLLPNL
jgi:putative transposase